MLTEQDHFVHVSGHPCRDELAEMYRWTRPRIAVPVHGELRHMSEHARLARALQVPEAVMLRLAPGPATIIDEVPSGRIHLDGKILIEEGAGLARARRALGNAGMIAITLVLDSKGPRRDRANRSSSTVSRSRCMLRSARQPTRPSSVTRKATRSSSGRTSAALRAAPPPTPGARSR